MRALRDKSEIKKMKNKICDSPRTRVRVIPVLVVSSGRTERNEDGKIFALIDKKNMIFFYVNILCASTRFDATNVRRRHQYLKIKGKSEREKDENANKP